MERPTRRRDKADTGGPLAAPVAWANLAAATLPSDQRKDAVDVRDAAAAKMTPQQIGEAQRLAREWKPITTK
jgi:hypothetical protein